MEEDAIEIAKIIVRIDNMEKKVDTVCDQVSDLKTAKDSLDGSWATLKWLIGLLGLSQLIGIISIWIK